MDLAAELLTVGLQYYFPDGKVPPYDLDELKRELVDMNGSNAEDYAFHFFVTFTPPIIRRLYPETAEEFHTRTLLPLIEKLLTTTK